MGDAEDGGGDQFPRAASPASLFAAVWSGFRLLFFWRFSEKTVDIGLWM